MGHATSALFGGGGERAWLRDAAGWTMDVQLDLRVMAVILIRHELRRG